MQMERRTSMRPDLLFSSPLVIYKWTSEKAYTYIIKIIDYLLENPIVDVIYVEDTEKINLEIVEKYKKNENKNNSEENKNSGKIQQFQKDISTPDLCIVIGGDGTTLWTNHLFANVCKPPFLNFNLGTLGYMAIYSYEDYIQVLDELYNTEKKMTFERRATLNCQIFHSHELKQLNSCSNLLCNKDEEFKIGEVVREYQGNALNDICIERTSNAHIINLKIYLNNEPLTVVKCDGLIISTSTGSTAYNLSAGGSVIHYDVDCLILNAICPHSLSFRAITLPRDMILKIVPCSNSFDKIIVNSDNIEKVKLTHNQFVEVSLSDNYANFIVLEKFVKNRVNLWKQKIVDQLGWNNAFKNVD